MWEIGKKRSDSEKEFDRTVDYLRDTIAEYKNLQREGSHINVVDGTLAQIRRGPRCGPLPRAIQLPPERAFCVLLPAILMGNTCVFKPAKYGVLLMVPLLEAFAESFPPGVINVVFGRGRTLVPDHGFRRSRRPRAHRQQQEQQCADFPASKPNRVRQVLGLEAKIQPSSSPTPTSTPPCVSV